MINILCLYVSRTLWVFNTVPFPFLLKSLCNVVIPQGESQGGGSGREGKEEEREGGVRKSNWTSSLYNNLTPSSRKIHKTAKKMFHRLLTTGNTREP